MQQQVFRDNLRINIEASTVSNVKTSDIEKMMGGYNECIRKILILASCAHVIDFSAFSFQTLLKTHTLDCVVKVTINFHIAYLPPHQMDKLQLPEFLDLILFRCVDFQSNATM